MAQDRRDSKKPKSKDKSKDVKKNHLKATPANTEGSEYDGSNIWKGFDLAALGVPSEAWPSVDRPNKGKHGYTLVSDTTGAVLLTHNLSQVLFDSNLTRSKGSKDTQYFFKKLSSLFELIWDVKKIHLSHLNRQRRSNACAARKPLW